MCNLRWGKCVSSPLWGIFFGISSNYSIEISGLLTQILRDFSYMLVMHKIYIYNGRNKVVIRLLHSYISDLWLFRAQLLWDCLRTSALCTGWAVSELKQSEKVATGVQIWHRPYTVQTGENYLYFRKCNTWNFCYYFLRCLFHFFSCSKLLKVISFLHMACDLKNRVLYTCFGVK